MTLAFGDRSPVYDSNFAVAYGKNG
jgi:hypothetical protein